MSTSQKIPLMTLNNLGLACGGVLLCEHLSMDIFAGDRIAILGPNGSGKTTLLHTLTGLQKAQSGDIFLQQKKLTDWSNIELAQKLGLLFQSTQDDMPATVMETVLLGRLPHQRAWQSTSEADWAASNDALMKMNLTALVDREIAKLSGGERQRVAIASLLAQSPLIYFLDEPTNHLDISFQIKTMQIFSELSKNKERAMLMATHDINLAARFCDRIVLLGGQGQVIVGDVHEVLTESLLSTAFSFDIRRISNDSHYWFYPAGFDGHQ
ncbi:MAG: ABC transporter ATP-binding protein [Pseudohongiella sp.]|nr:ABC transporter ATP-binding protein [Pseudohongiella sp.]